MTPAAAIRAALGDEVRDLVVWLDPGGRCVHVAGCSTLTEDKAPIVPYEPARDHWLTACRHCKPVVGVDGSAEVRRG